MATTRCARLTFAVSLALLIPYLILRLLIAFECLFGPFYTDAIDFLQLVTTVSCDTFYVFQGVMALLRTDVKRLDRCSRYFAICFVLSILSVILTTCFDDEDMINVFYDAVNCLTIAFSGVCLFHLNMKMQDERDDANNN